MNMMYLHKRKMIMKTIAVFMLLNFTAELFYPTVASAVTSGPVQEEHIAGGQAGDSEYVDLYSGDFKYNIPLLAIPGPNGGYPLSLSYNSGNINMESEASWVGLGWNLNIGAVNREMRGLPDDYNGEGITTNYHFRPYRQYSITLLNEKEKFGFAVPYGPSAIPINNPFLQFNNYKGFGYGFGFGISVGQGIGLADAGLGLKIDSQNGIGYSASVQLMGAGISLSGTNREGLQGINMSTGATNPIYGRGFAIDQPVPNVIFPTTQEGGAYDIFVGMAGTTPGDFKASTFNSGSNEYVGINFSHFMSKPFTSESFSLPGYGYLNTHNSTDASIKDFNRDVSEYTHKSPNLPSSSYSYDNFMVSCQGMGGVFRAHRIETGILGSAYVSNNSNNENGGIEGGLNTYTGTPTNYHLGLDWGNNTSINTSGAWGNTDMTDLTTPLAPSTSAVNYERHYFKMMDEVNGENTANNYYQSWQQDEAVRSVLSLRGDWANRRYTTTNKIVDDELGTEVTVNSNFSQKSARQIRTTYIQALNRTDGQKFGREKIIEFNDYDGTGDLNSSTNYFKTNKFTGVYNNLYTNHLSEINIVQTDGTHYIFGLPVYNHVQKDIVYSNPDTEDAADGGMKKISTDDQTYKSNMTGGAPTNQFKKETVLPPYVSSWLITTIHSDDYYDLTNNGPTDDDYGYWVKFDYKRIYNNYKWRSPYNQAYYNGGQLGENEDNTTFQSYGEKDVFYVSTIETKTHIAVFYISTRSDAREASAYWNNSGQGSRSLCKLDKISLFHKSEYQANPSTAIPLQSVHFEYDYSLCDNTPNSAATPVDGKLTLKKVYFTSENSTRGQKSPYTFVYKTENVDFDSYPNLTSQEQTKLTNLNNIENPVFNDKNMDRWGNYTINDNVTGAKYNNGYYPYIRYPYTEQEKPSSTAADEDYRNGAPWRLRKVIAPNGGIMRVFYESDDYAYVENKPAQQMFDIVEVENGTFDSNSDNRDDAGANEYEAGLTDGTSSTDRFKIYFKLTEQVQGLANATDASWYIYNNFVKNLEYLYFRVQIDLRANTHNNYDEVAGYAKILRPVSPTDSDITNKMGLLSHTGANSDIGFITVESVSLSNTLPGIKVHPIRKAAWQYLKLERPELFHNITGEPSGTYLGQAASLLTMFTGNLTDIYSILAGGYYNFCAAQGFAKEMKLQGKSKIRLCEPDGRKYGGGYRVRKITFNDNWISNTNKSLYGQEFFYDTKGDGTGTSTGVAYEPELGGDEDALREPKLFNDSHFLRTPYSLFSETPVMKMFYPAPGVGYGKVTVRSIAPQIADDKGSRIDRTASPYSVTEFYTPKDFPVLFDETDISGNPPAEASINIPGLASQLSVNNTRSQGYSIVLNDMAGKLKRVASYKRFPFDQPGNLISEVQYIYQTKDPYSATKVNKLNNYLTAVKGYLDGSSELIHKTEQAYFGTDVDVWIDFHENYSKNTQHNNEANLDIFQTGGGAWIPIPSFYISDYEEWASFKTVVINKVIRKTGMLKEIVTNDDGSVTKSQMVAYDYDTGEPVITKTNDEFDEDVYSHTYNAYWIYNRMKGKYLNEGITLTNSGMTLSGGTFTITGDPVNFTSYFVVGDKLLVNSNSPAEGTCHVSEVNTTSMKLITSTGSAFSITGTITSVKIIRSGYKNLYDLTCGNVVAKTYTVDGQTNQYSFDKIIDANAVKFNEIWEDFLYSNCPGSVSSPVSPINPFELGIMGSWRPSCTYKYAALRDYFTEQQRDGVYNNFAEFKWWNTPSSKWILQTNATMYSPFGFLLEQKKSLSTTAADGIYSANEYAYNNRLLNASAQNAQYSEIFFTGFEDYYNYTSAVDHCKYNKLDFYNPNASDPDITLSETYAHTGKKSIKILASNVMTAETIIDETNNSRTCDKCHETTTLYEGGPGLSRSSCYNITKLDLAIGKKYTVSSWVRSTHAGDYNYAEPEIKIRFYDNLLQELTSSAVTIDPSGKLVEGWQRIYGSFTVPNNTYKIVVELKSGNATAYFDDFRIQPMNAEMVTYVYDIKTNKIVAQLDGENFATFFSYDESGALSKMHKETIDGIKTITESRGSNYVQQ